VEVIAPLDKDSEFTEKIKVINKDYQSDYCEIDVYLQTPKSKQVPNTFLFRFLERFPNAFQVIRQIYGL
jgi:hypothetical protein